MEDEAMQQVADLRAAAKSAALRNDEAAAEAAYARVLEREADDLDALKFLAYRNMVRGDGQRAIALLQTATRAHPDAADAWHRLGTACLMAGDAQAAADHLRRALDLDAGLFVARLRLGVACENAGDAHGALVAYFMALHVAQAQGRWLSDETTEPGAREVVLHAVQYVAEGRHALFHRALDPLRARYGRAGLARVEQALACYLGERAVDWPDRRQRPTFFYFPGIPTRTFYPRGQFPWYAELEAQTDAIRAELRAVLKDPDGIEPFLGNEPGGRPDLLKAWGPDHAIWDAYFFHRHGERYDAHCARCPRTAAALDKLPLDFIRAHSPEVLFSVLRPGTHILLHRGVTNARLTTHLPLIVPRDCAIRVGGETHAWKEGRCVTFDDSVEHEAWNKSDQTRVILLFDVWNPDLTEVEQLAVKDLVEAIGDFTAACRMPPPGDRQVERPAAA